MKGVLKRPSAAADTTPTRKKPACAGEPADADGEPTSPSAKLALATSLADGDEELAHKALALTRSDRAHWQASVDSGKVSVEVVKDWGMLGGLKFGCHKKLNLG